MADNVTVDNGVLTDYDVLSDDVGGKHCQIVKLSLSGDGEGAAVETALPVSDGGGSITVDGTVAVSGSVTVTDGSGSLTVDGTVTANAGTGTFTTKETAAGTGTTSQVADSASSVTILAANSSRLGGSVFNDSSAVLYLKLAASAATVTDYSVKIFTNGYFEIPANYTGAITGIWATDPGDGAARVTEFTA